MSDIRARLADALRERIIDGYLDWPETYGQIADAVLSLPGIAVVELPEPGPQSDLYDVYFDVESDDDFMTGPRTPRVCIDKEAGEIYQVCTPTAHIKPVEACSLAAALLAAAVQAQEEQP